METLTANNLSIGYSEQKVLMSALNLSLSSGQLIGLVGQNGVGKSTFIRTICGLQPALSGDVYIGKQSISKLRSKDISKKISVVLTGKPETLNLTVLEVVALGRHPYSGWLGNLNQGDKDKIEASISSMEINYLATKRLYELSDGQLQKVLIARALAQDTDIIVLDEPTSHLDLKNKIEVLSTLEKIAHSGKGVLISTHEVQLAANVCDQFWCMDFGKNVAVGPPHDLIASGKLQDYLHVPKGALEGKK